MFILRDLRHMVLAQLVSADDSFCVGLSGRNNEIITLVSYRVELWASIVPTEQLLQWNTRQNKLVLSRPSVFLQESGKSFDNGSAKQEKKLPTHFSLVASREEEALSNCISLFAQFNKIPSTQQRVKLNVFRLAFLCERQKKRAT
jgi:hypothetical protein